MGWISIKKSTWKKHTKRKKFDSPKYTEKCDIFSMKKKCLKFCIITNDGKKIGKMNSIVVIKYLSNFWMEFFFFVIDT